MAVENETDTKSPYQILPWGGGGAEEGAGG